MKKKKLIFNVNVISKFVKTEFDFGTKTIMAYILGREKLCEETFLKFIKEETGYDFVTVFAVLIMYLYKRYSESMSDAIYDYLAENFGVLFEDFKNECFIESEVE